MSGNKTQRTAKSKPHENTQKLKKELSEKTKLAEERLNQLKYMQADFDNYRKTSEREKNSIIETANESLIRELLTVIDDFERMLMSVESKKEKEGLELIYRNFYRTLENRGLKKIEALGRKFDPHYHEVVMKGKSDKKEDTVLEEIQKGYLLNSKVIRHSKVKISENVSNKRGDENG